MLELFFLSSTYLLITDSVPLLLFVSYCWYSGCTDLVCRSCFSCVVTALLTVLQLWVAESWCWWLAVLYNCYCGFHSCSVASWMIDVMSTSVSLVSVTRRIEQWWIASLLGATKVCLHGTRRWKLGDFCMNFIQGNRMAPLLLWMMFLW